MHINDNAEFWLRHLVLQKCGRSLGRSGVVFNMQVNEILTLCM